jgi:dihydroorotate dehydrogenase
VNPRATIDIIDGLKQYLQDNQMESVQEIIGGLLPSGGL